MKYFPQDLALRHICCVPQSVCDHAVPELTATVLARAVTRSAPQARGQHLHVPTLRLVSHCSRETRVPKPLVCDVIICRLSSDGSIFQVCHDLHQRLSDHHGLHHQAAH